MVCAYLCSVAIIAPNQSCRNHSVSLACFLGAESWCVTQIPRRGYRELIYDVGRVCSFVCFALPAHFGFIAGSAQSTVPKSVQSPKVRSRRLSGARGFPESQKSSSSETLRTCCSSYGGALGVVHLQPSPAPSVPLLVDSLPGRRRTASLTSL